MQIVLIANRSRAAEFLGSAIDGNSSLQITEEIKETASSELCIDLNFDGSEQRIKQLDASTDGLVAVSSMLTTCSELPGRFIRINGWPGFLNGPLSEAAGKEKNRSTAEKGFAQLGKNIEWVEDRIGFISPRIVSMIINEAYFALEEKLSTKQEMDTAMKLGTNYPYGPFEWSEKIGLDNICSLLERLSVTDRRYLPAPLLKKSLQT
jgi:3-hydroxybutyryl-CoA dehydrogenase